MIRPLTEKLYAGFNLDYDESRKLLSMMSEGEVSEILMSSILTVFKMRGIQVDELKGFQDELLERSISFIPDADEYIDVCGTGGDGKNSFNISTLAAFVVAGAGYAVVKHGNYGVSSLCGSSNVLEELGVRFTNDKNQLQKQLQESGITFLHAPLFHPAMKAAAPVRRALATRTFFNMLGPLVNPSRPTHQLTGVFSLELGRMYDHVQRANGRQYAILHGLDGYDEVSLTSGTKIFNNQKDEVLYPTDFGLEYVSPESIHGGETLDVAKDIFMDVLDSKEPTVRTEVVCANAALGIQCFEPTRDIRECVQIAENSLLGGKALHSFNMYRKYSNN